jgi:hypothetical protein
MVRDWNIVGKWLNKVWEKEAKKDRKWDRKCFDVFYEGLVESEKSAWVASRVQGTELADDILGQIVRFYKGESGASKDRTVMVVRKRTGDKVVRRESFESLHEVQVPEEEDVRTKRPKKVSKLEKEEESDLEDDVKEVAVVQKDQGAMEHVVTALSEIAMLKGQKAEETEEQRPRGVRRAEAGSHGEQGREGERRQPQGWGRGGRSQWPAAGRGQGQWGSPPPDQRGQGQWGSPPQGQWGQGRGQSGSVPMGALQGNAGKKECRYGERMSDLQNCADIRILGLHSFLKT